MVIDYHIHTNYSDDCEYSMEEAVKDAIALGAKEICITDHVDYGVKTDWNSGEKVTFKAGMYRLNVDYPKFMQELQEQRQKYGEQITIKLGMEFGLQMHTIDKYEALFAKYPFDFITRYDENGIYPFEKVKPLIEEVLKTVIADGKGIEVNTSS